MIKNIQDLKVGDKVFISDRYTNRHLEPTISKIGRKCIMFENEPRLRYNMEENEMEAKMGSEWDYTNKEMWHSVQEYTDYLAYKKRKRYVQEHFHALSEETIEKLYKELGGE